MGAYHSGVEVNGKEWTFAGGAGVFDHAPREAPGKGGVGGGGRQLPLSVPGYCFVNGHPHHHLDEWGHRSGVSGDY